MKFVRDKIMCMDTVAALIRREDKFFLTKENKDDENLSEISGEIERGNTHREALREKVRQEVGIEVEIEKKVKKVDNSENRKHWYLVEEVKQSEENPDPDKIQSEQKGEWVQISETGQMHDRTAEFSEKHREELRN